MCNPDYSIQIIFYYKNLKSSNIVIKNAPISTLKDPEKHNLIYCFKCPINHDKPTYYVGKTTTTLNQRMAQHKSIQDHMQNYHNIKSTKLERLSNTSIIEHESNSNRLSIKEALYIRHSSPEINKQFDHFQRTLKLNPHRKVDLDKIFRPPDQAKFVQNNSSHSNSSRLNLSFESSHILSASSSQLPQTSSSTPVNYRSSTPVNYRSPTISFNDQLVTHTVSPNIQHRITQFLQNNRNETSLHHSPVRRSLRPRNHSLNYRE